MEQFSQLCAFRWGKSLSQESYPLNVFVLFKSVLEITLLRIHLTQDPWTLIILSNMGLWKCPSFFMVLVENGQLTCYRLCLIYT